MATKFQVAAIALSTATALALGAVGTCHVVAPVVKESYMRSVIVTEKCHQAKLDMINAIGNSRIKLLQAKRDNKTEEKNAKGEYKAALNEESGRVKGLNLQSLTQEFIEAKESKAQRRQANRGENQVNAAAQEQQVNAGENQVNAVAPAEQE